MFRSMISLVILGLVSTLSLDLQASGKSYGGKAPKERKHSRLLRSSGLPIGVVVQGRVSREARALAREAGIPIAEAEILRGAAEAWMRELELSGRLNHLSPQQRGAMTRMMKFKKYGRRIKVADRPVVEALGQFNAENIFAALQSAVTAGELKTKLDEIIAFALRITTGSRGKLAAAIRETAEQLQALRANLEELSNDVEIGVLDDNNDYDGGGDFGGGDDLVAPELSLKQRLMKFVSQNRRSGYKLLTVCTVFAGAAWFAPVYLPVVLVGSAVGATVSATARAAVSKMAGVPVTSGDMAEAAIDGFFSGSISSVMPGGSFVNAGATGATISALRAVCEGKGAKEIGKDALVGGVGSVAAYGATSWFFPQGAPVSVEEDRSRALMVVPQPLGVEPMAADHRNLMRGSGLPEFSFPAVEDRSRAMVPVVSQQPMSFYSTAVATVPGDMGVCLAQPMCRVSDVAADLQARMIALERMIAAQDGAIQTAAKPLARRFYDGIGLTNLFDRVLERTAATTARTPQCALDAATIAELQQCVGVLEQTVAEQNAAIQEALKPMAKKVYDGVGLTGFLDRLLGRSVHGGGTAGFACASSAVTADDLSGCVARLEETVVRRDALILEALTPLARKFYNVIGLTSLVAAVRSY